jgi:hypothetical protein
VLATYPCQRVSFEVGVLEVEAEGVTAIRQERPVLTALLPLGTVLPVYRLRHPFQLFTRHRQMQQFVSFIGFILQHSLINGPL